MNRKIITTKDGSSTVVLEDANISYHSMFGAVQESQHIYIDNCLKYFTDNKPQTQPVHIFEMGFGTGLNALLSLQFAINNNIHVYYTCVEKFPLSIDEVKQLNYISYLNIHHLNDAFINMHIAITDEEIIIHPLFIFKKHIALLQQLSITSNYHIIYYDAFAPEDAPELWTPEIFKLMHQCLTTKGLLITYSSKTSVRKALLDAGFAVTKLKGPKGKREIIRAEK